jgi:hypothetical protein
MPDGRTMDDAADGRVTEHHQIVSQVSARFDTLRAEALPQTASREMLEEVAGEKWT